MKRINYSIGEKQYTIEVNNEQLIYWGTRTEQNLIDILCSKPIRDCNNLCYTLQGLKVSFSPETDCIDLDILFAHQIDAIREAYNKILMDKKSSIKKREMRKKSSAMKRKVKKNILRCRGHVL